MYITAFILSDEDLRLQFEKRYKATATLYYKAQPSFDTLLGGITENIKLL